MNKVECLVGDHADLINDDSVNVPPVSSQVIESLGTQLAILCIATVFHRQVEGLVDGQASNVEGGHTGWSHQLATLSCSKVGAFQVFSDHTDDVTLSGSSASGDE